MGNCGSHISSQKETPEMHDPSVSHNLFDKHIMQSRSAPYLAELGHRNSFPESERYRVALDHGLLFCRSGDSNCDLAENDDGLSDIPNARSVTPTSGVRPKSYVRQFGVQNSNSPIGYRPCSSLSTESHNPPEQRYGHPNLGIDSRKSSNSASQMLKYGLGSAVSTNPCSQSHYSASANASISYGHSNSTPDTNSIRDHRSSPVNYQIPPPSSICAESDLTKMKYAQNMALKYPQNSNKFLIQHSFTNTPKQSTISRTEAISGNVGYPKYFSRKITGKHFLAIFDYLAHSEEDLTVHKGDSLTVLEQSDVDWWLVENTESGAHGYVPSAYLAEEGSVEVYEWYFREMSRKDSERLLLLNGNVRGTFLVRESETTQGALSLSVRDCEPKRGDVVKHFKIKHDLVSGIVCITSKKVFSNLLDLIANYTSHADGLGCRLTKSCPRPPPVLSDLSRRTKDDWEIPRSSLVLQERLGAGQFGEVWKGEWNGTTQVAIKTLKPGTMTKEEFLKEARIMKGLCHAHMVRLFAVVTTEPIYIVTELMSNGSLLHYLRSDEGKTLEMKQLVDIMAQIAGGMAYLEEKHLIHRDLAARNILVGDNNMVKIADFGLARLTDAQTESYTSKQGGKFPFKWTSPEAIRFGQFTIKSDVWSFGVVLYEIVTYGQLPFPTMNNSQMLQEISNGYRMPCPSTCPPSIYTVMLQTWDSNPDLRPSFDYLTEYFEDYFVHDEETHKPQGINGTPYHRPAPHTISPKRRAGYPYMSSPVQLEVATAQFSPRRTPFEVSS